MDHVQPLEPRRLLSAGSLDPTFLSGGRGVLSLGPRNLDAVYNTAVQPDGKVVLVGEIRDANGQGTNLAVARLLPDATPDPAFGLRTDGTPGGGLFELPLPTNTDTAFGVALQPDGKLVVVGSIGEIDATEGLLFGQALVIRLMPDGLPDPTFGVDLPEGETGGAGFVFLPLSTNDAGLPNSEARAVGLQSDGRIVVGGAANLVAGGRSSFAAARLNPDGSLDRTFGASGTGIEVTDIDGVFTAIFGLAVLPDDRILLTGTAIFGDDEGQVASLFLTARLTRDGLEDFSFGDEGVVVTPFPVAPGETVLPIPLSVLALPDGKALVGGFIVRGVELFGTTFVRSGIAVARINPDGSHDPSFGNGNGFVETYFNDDLVPPVNLFSNQLVLTSNGRFFAAGRVGRNDGSGELTGSVVVRYNADGSLDRTFNRNGKLVLMPEGELRPASLPGSGSFTNAARSAGTLVAEIPGGGTLLLASRPDGQLTAARLIADGPDLITRVDRFRGGAVLGGTRGTLTVRLSNQGTLPFSGTIPVELLLSRDTRPSDDDRVLLSATSRVQLRPGQSRTQSLRFAYPRGTDVEGAYFVLTRANTSRAAAEGNYVNNVSSSPVTALVTPAFIDLRADVVSAPASPVPAGRRAAMTLRLTNSGTVPAAGAITLELFASPDDLLSADDAQLAGQRPVRINVRPGDRPLRLTAVVPSSLTAGTYRLLLRLDASSLADAVQPVRVVLAESLLTVV
ncbi:MAG: hypothetical protein ACK4PI_07560 [Tepidisphaerales bacterium]